MRSILSKFAFLLIILSFFYNVSYAKKNETVKNYQESAMYQDAKAYLDAKRFKLAKQSFLKINDIHPFSDYGKKAQVMAAFAAYSDKDYIDAATIAESYINIYTAEQDLEYMADLRADAYFKMIKDIQNDTEIIYKAQESYQYILDNFPKSKYYAQAAEKMQLINDMISAKSVYIGAFYQKNSQYHSAIHRFLQVANQINSTKYHGEAALRIAQSYAALGLEQEAEKYLALSNQIMQANEITYIQKEQHNIHTKKTKHNENIDAQPKPISSAKLIAKSNAQSNTKESQK